MVRIIPGRERDLGDLNVKRVLPCSVQQMVGPFIFFDHMGPVTFLPSKGIDVRPHPHIHLATVTYLFEGTICHRDSLGTIQLIEPGAINWMVAGHGIVHSERTPTYLRSQQNRLNGIQCWVALPNDKEDMPPQFFHQPASALPQFSLDGAEVKLLLGEFLGKRSHVPIYSPLFYLDAHFTKNTQLRLPLSHQEIGIYVVAGKVSFQGTEVPEFSMGVAYDLPELNIEAQRDSRIILLGGEPVGKRFIYWNFVSSREDAIREAMHVWQPGPGDEQGRFPKIPTDDQEFIPLPTAQIDRPPPGTIM